MTTRTLNWFQKQTDSDTVLINVTKTYDDGDTKGVDEQLSDAALTAHAVADGRTTWDETDICDLADCTLYVDGSGFVKRA